MTTADLVPNLVPTKTAEIETVDLTTTRNPLWLEKSNMVAKIVEGKGKYYDICIIDFNIDIETGICSIAVDQTTGEGDRSNCCHYCYASYLFKKDPRAYKVKTIRESVFKKVKDTFPEFSVLRIGKNYECGSILARNELYEVLELCVKYNVRPIVTSKLLEYDPRLARLVVESNGTVHISLGNDELEPGAVKQGANNKSRYTVATLYKTYGVNTWVRVVEDITRPMPEFIKRIYQENFQVLITPLSYKDKATVLEKLPDTTWDEEIKSGRYEFTSGGLHPKKVHDDWKPYIKNSCGLINGTMKCNNCGLGKVYYSDEVGFSKTKYKAALKAKGWNL